MDITVHILLIRSSCCQKTPSISGGGAGTATPTATGYSVVLRTSVSDAFRRVMNTTRRQVRNGDASHSNNIIVDANGGANGNGGCDSAAVQVELKDQHSAVQVQVVKSRSGSVSASACCRSASAGGGSLASGSLNSGSCNSACSRSASECALGAVHSAECLVAAQAAAASAASEQQQQQRFSPEEKNGTSNV